jgi:hypothetical protein
VLVTNGSNVPSLSQTLPTQVQANITALTGMTGLIEYPIGLIFNGTGGVGDSLNRNTGTAAGQNLTVRAGAPASGVGNVAGGNLILSSGIAEGTGISSIIFQVPDPSSPGTADNLPVTQMILNSTALNLATGTDLQTNGSTRISSAGAGTLTSLTLGSPLTVPNGGTGLSTIPAHGVLIGEGTGAIVAAAPSTAGYVLTSNGGSSDPTWQASTGTVFSVSNSDGSLAIAPTTGNVVASLAPSHSNAWTAQQTFSNTTTAAAAATVSNSSTPSTGTALGATIAATGVSTGAAGNVALQLTASGSTGTGGNTALRVTSGNVNISSLTASVPVFTDANKNLISTPIIPSANGGTGTSTVFTPGSVIFAGSGGAYAQDNSNFFWDETNKTFTIGGAGYELPQSTISTSGNINNFLQINNQNLSNGNDASTDFVATADNGSNSNFYIDMGINGSHYAQASYDIGKGDDGYLVAQGGNLDLGAGATGDSVILFTGGNNTTNRALSIDGSQIITFPQYGAGALSTDGSGVVSSGTLAVGNGGTGLATIAAHSVILGEGTSAVAVATPSTAGYVLTSTGASSDPTWQAASGAVLSVSNSDGTLTISPTTGNVVVSLALGHANIWTGTQTFPLTDAQGSALTNSINNATTTLLSGSKISGNISGNAANVTGIIALANGGTNAALTASNGGIFYSTGTAGAILSGTATAHQVLLSGSSSAPSWSTATYPATTTANQLLYSNAANTVAGLSTANGGILNTSSTGVPSITATPMLGVAGPSGTTGTLSFANSANANLTTLQAGAATAAVTYTLPTAAPATAGYMLTSTTTGGLSWVAPGTGAVTSFSAGTTGLTPNSATTGAIVLGGTLALASGGTNASLTANSGGIFYSTSSAGAILAGTATADQMLLSGASGAPSWSTNTYPVTDAKGDLHYASATNTLSGLAIGSPGQMLTVASGLPAWTTATYPSTTAINTLLYSNAANTVAALATANGGILNTSSTGVPSITATPTLGVAGPTGTTGSISFANSTNANLTTIQAGVATVAATYTLPTALPGSTGLFLTSTTSGGMSWTSAITGAVNYNITALQNTAAITATNYLFDIGYASTASTNGALGAQITSTNTAAGAGTIAQNSATGLTINANATGTSSTTGTATGLVVNVGGVGAADTISPNIVLHTINPSSLSYGTAGVYSEITTSDSGLILQETGDMYGTSILALQNRTGSNGALFQTIPNAANLGTNVVDYGFIPGTGVQSNIRLEARTAFLRGSQNQTATVPEEFQYYLGTTTANPQYVLSIGQAATMLETGKFGIGYISPTSGTAGGAGSPLEKLDVHSMGLYYGASNIILSDSGTSSITAPNTGSLKFQGTKDGISSFTAGAQGSNYVNYTLPTVTTAPIANQVLSISSVSGSGTSASPYAAAMTWTTQGPSMITGGTTGAFNTGSTRFFNPSGIMTTVTATSASLANGSYMIAPRSGIISKLYAQITTASGSGKSWTVTLTDGANTLSAILSNATTGNSGAGTLTVAAGDLISLSVVPSGTPTANTGAVWGFEIQ